METRKKWDRWEFWEKKRRKNKLQQPVNIMG